MYIGGIPDKTGNVYATRVGDGNGKYARNAEIGKPIAC